ncbi:hem peroxidase - like 10 [Theobroma cacao]|nr:hem peroxidase - like 10 [Theobroma cacao]
MKAGYSIFVLFVSLALFGIVEVCNARGAHGFSNLSYNYYRRTCPRAEKIVRGIIRERARTNPALGAKLIRMQFHDCFVREAKPSTDSIFVSSFGDEHGCDASVLLDTVNSSFPSEKKAVPNLSLSGFDVIDDIKTALEKACPKVVSCADILALAARDAVSAPFGRRLWDVPLGRRDGRISLASEINGNIPGPFANFSSLLQTFNKKGLDVNDLVILSGAHTIGVSHCGAFSRRLYNFTGKGDADPSLDRTYAIFLRKQCPNPASQTITVEMDPGSSLKFDTHYYDVLLQNKGLFQSDAALLTDGHSRGLVTTLRRKRSFFPAFATSMMKMGAIEVLTGNAGEIRANCRVVNP